MHRAKQSNPGSRAAVLRRSEQTRFRLRGTTKSADCIARSALSKAGAPLSRTNEQADMPFVCERVRKAAARSASLSERSEQCTERSNPTPDRAPPC